MKKILFLMLITCAFSSLINAYEIEIYNDENAEDTLTRYVYYIDDDGKLYQLSIRANGNINYKVTYDSYFFSSLNSIRVNTSNYISKNDFNAVYKNNLNLLNDLYLQKTQPFLNYLYNPNRTFSYTNYIEYENYQILYNGDGLAVESIVDGVWAGLYSDSQKSQSGAMYNKNGFLVYYNGKEVTPVTSFLVWLQKFTNRVVIETFEEIQRSLVAGIIAAVVLVLAIVRLVLELLPSSITPRRRRYYGGGRGTLPDYGDGSQVAASVRARLAAKNRALKARAYDRSGVEQSLQNSILFDLENDR